MNTENNTAALEAILFAAGEPLSVEKISEILEIGILQTAELLRQLERELEDRGLTIRTVAGGKQLAAKKEFYPLILRLGKIIERKLSAPMLETLSIVAYMQPVTRAEIENIRGVNVDGVVAKLAELELIEEVGRKQIAGRPILYGTTEKFLSTLGIKSLDELPKVEKNY